MTQLLRETRYPPHVWAAVAMAAMLMVISSAVVWEGVSQTSHAASPSSADQATGFQLGPTAQ